jgi:Protein of unknown function (DUF2690)/Helix-turn-helix domain
VSQVPVECGRLAAELRALRTRAGLSLAALGAESSYSKSSWERYLNGKALPPWQAVQTLCRLAGEPEPKARALWELAESAWRGRGVVAASGRTAAPAAVPAAPATAPAVGPAAEARPPVSPVPPVPPVAGWRSSGRRWPVTAAVLVAVLICAAVTAGAARQWSGGRAPSPAPTAFHVGCSGHTCAGADPQVMLCGVQPDTLLQLQTTAGAGLEIRYSPLCRAAWARVWATQVGDQITISAPDQPTRSVRVTNTYAAQAFLYTPMVSVGAPGTVLRACLTPPAPGPSQCFSSRVP